jgi:hypothetical protein
MPNDGSYRYLSVWSDGGGPRSGVRETHEG